MSTEEDGERASESLARVFEEERAEFLRISNSKAGYHFAITPATTRNDFLALFEKVTGDPLTQDGFVELDTKFHAFRREFSASAQLRS